MKTIYCTHEHAAQILDILNEAIINSTALYEYLPRKTESMQSWFAAKTQNNYPVIGITDDSNKLLGFGTYGSFRNWPAYKYCIEHSLYVHKNYRGQGVGKKILQEIIKNAEMQQYHCLIAGIDATNINSIRLHQKFGFELCGTIRQAGYKFSRWLDLQFYQKLLTTPVHPDEK